MPGFSSNGKRISLESKLVQAIADISAYCGSIALGDVAEEREKHRLRGYNRWRKALVRMEQDPLVEAERR
jgi:hypothetical protein